MRTGNKSPHLTRVGVLEMLSEEEVASVGRAESAAVLADGDVYVDLARLDQGVRRARGATTPLRPVLPKKAVHEDTWRSLVEHLAALDGVARRAKI
jgi:hypothetical protein